MLISGVDLYQKSVLILARWPFIKGCPYIRSGLYEGFHCISDIGYWVFCPYIRSGLYEGFHCISDIGYFVLTSRVAFMRGSTVLVI